MRLIPPSREYLDSYIVACDEYRERGIAAYAFFGAGECDIFKRIEDYRTGSGLPEGYVKATYLWLVDDDEFIGEIAIRHSLTEALLRFGGNIGYGVRYSRWGEGAGTLMLSLALVYAKEVIGLNRVLITCNDDNRASARIIEKNGGILQDKIVNTVNGADRLSRRYWIEL